LSLITRQVREVKNLEEEIRQMKRKLENFDRYASLSNVAQVQGETVGGTSQGILKGEVSLYH